MVKEKKITIKYFLNKRLKPTIVGEEKFYPVYVRITFDRKSTKVAFHSLNIINGGISEERFHELIELRKDEGINKVIRDYEDLIKNTVKYETQLYKDKFLIAGIGKRLLYYEEELGYVLERVVSKKLKDWLKKSVSQDELLEIFHELLSFSESFYLAKDKFKGNLLDSIPMPLKICIATYSLYSAHLSLAFKAKYENADALEEEIEMIPTKIKDWIIGITKKSFLDFLLNSPNKELIYKFEGKNSPIKRLWEEILDLDLKPSSLLKAIDFMIVEGGK